jgi:hypothetical protein
MNKIAFPLGFHRLHQDLSMNFQMNRWYSWVGEPALPGAMAARDTASSGK